VKFAGRAKKKLIVPSAAKKRSRICVANFGMAGLENEAEFAKTFIR
jgi:hypothetical protein